MPTKPTCLKLAVNVYVLLLVVCAVISATVASTAGLARTERPHGSSPASLAALYAPLAQGHDVSAAVVIRKGTARSVNETFLAGDCDLSFVAHEDDDLLFISPDIPTRIQAGDKVRTVFLTAGDAGLGFPYWLNREAGIQDAYAQMASVANAWTASDQPFGEKLIRIYTLDAAPNISVAFLRLPDGNVNTGGGYAVTGYQSMQRLWEGEIATMSSLDGANTYTKAELIQTLVDLMMDLRAQHIQTQDGSNLYGNDHPDHRYGARCVFEAHQIYAASGAHHTFTTYRGYNISNEPANLTQAQRDAKWAIFNTYAEHDSAMCGGTGTGCLIGGDYDKWSYREYPIAQVKDLSGAISVLSGGCLTAGADIGDGTAPVVISACPGGGAGVSDASSQTWSIHGDGSVTGFDARCLEVRGGLPFNETPVQLAACAGTPEQRWTAFENGQIRGLAGKCLDVRDGSSADGTPVQLYGCNAIPGQQWLLPLSSAQPVASPDFSLALAPGSSFSATVTAGESATYDLVLTPRAFAGTVSLNCSGAPQGATCTFSPDPVTLDGQNPVNVRLTVTTTARAVEMPRLFLHGPTLGRTRGPALLFLMLLLGLVTIFSARGRRAFLPLGVTLLVASLWAACGGESGAPNGGRAIPETAAGTYSLTIVATSGNLSRVLAVALKVN
jgi:LmbE family N-acetylglucosaminyl deacetylase